MYTDPTRTCFWRQVWQRDVRPFASLLSHDLIVLAAARAAWTRGAGPLGLLQLVWLALSCACDPRRSFADVLSHTAKQLRDLHAGPAQPPPPTGPRRGRHDPRVAPATPPSTAAFCQARAAIPWTFWTILLSLLADRFAEQHAARLRWQGRFRLLGLDGTTVNLPNWPELLATFGSASRGSGRRQAQARLVLLQLTLVRLPWRFDLTPLAQSEQEVAGRLLPAVQADDLVLMDRGFWAYRLFWQIQQQHAFFAIRQRKQVKFQTLRQLGPDDRLVVWQPKSAAAQKAIRTLPLPPALQLRVIDYHIAGFRPSAVVTNLLDATLVPAAAFVRLAAEEKGRRVTAAEVGLYHRRWEIETTFYELKVTQGLEGGIRSRSEAGVRYEVAGHLLLYQLLRWRLVEAAAQAGVADPLRLSYQEALEELADLRPALRKAGAARVTWLVARLLERLGSHVVPYRPGRHYRRPHDSKAKAKGGGRSQPASKLEPEAAGPQEGPARPPAEQRPMVA
jgi:hypothetical protein